MNPCEDSRKTQGKEKTGSSVAAGKERTPFVSAASSYAFIDFEAGYSVFGQTGN